MGAKSRKGRGFSCRLEKLPYINHIFGPSFVIMIMTLAAADIVANAKRLICQSANGRGPLPKKHFIAHKQNIVNS